MSEILLIIGGTGFIGKNLCLKAIDHGFKVIVLSLNNPNQENKVYGVEYLQADVSCFKDLKEKISTSHYDYVINLSGYIDHSSFTNGGKKVINDHFGGLQNIILSLKLSSVKRFVQIGSSDEYGNCKAPQNERMRENPISPYSLAKLASTQLAQMLHRTQGLPIVVLRLFLVYGPGQNSKRFIPQIIKGCLNSESFPTSNGLQFRDFCYIDDIVDGILKALKVEKANGLVINLASGEPIMIRELVSLVKKIIGRGSPNFGEIPYRTGENMELYADTLAAKNILEWEPTISIEEGIKKTIDYYSNED